MLALFHQAHLYRQARLSPAKEVTLPTVSMTMTNNGHNLLRDGTKGVNNPAITYVAFGSGTSTPTATQTKLDSELFRKAVTSVANGASVGESLINFYVGPSDATGDDFEELAFFGGSSATSAKDTGVMLARGLWTHNPKSGTESITVALDMTQ